jgi:hypothetical protein
MPRDNNSVTIYKEPDDCNGRGGAGEEGVNGDFSSSESDESGSDSNNSDEEESS